MKNKVLVTGGAGFIGSHLVDLLLAGAGEVVVIDNFSSGRRQNLIQHKANPKLRVIEADIADLKAILPHFSGIDKVFHVAGLADIVPSIVEPLNYYRSNVTGTLNVAEACRIAQVGKLVYAASSSCYGIADVYPTPESAQIRPQYPYALTKFLGEQIVMHWGKVYKFPAVSLRLFNVYGPRSRTCGTYGAVFGVFLAQKLAGRPFTVVGDGSQTRDFTFVRDVARAFIAAANSVVSHEVFNVASGNTYSINHLVGLLGGEVVHIPKRPGEPDRTQADITKIKKMLGWQSEVSFEEGVEELLKNISYWKDAPVWSAQKIELATSDWFRYLSKE